MPSERSKAEVINRDFLETRGKLLEVAASLDRLDRASRSGSEAPDSRLAKLRQAIEALLEPGPGRTETVQRIFSIDYDPNWIHQFGMREASSTR